MKRGRYIDVDAPHIVEMRAILGAIALFLACTAVVALVAGCSGGSLRDALRFNGVREVHHPVHGDCIEASLTVTAESINRSGTGYLGVCRGVLDAGAVSDAGASEGGE